VLARWRRRLLAVGSGGKIVMGLVLIVVGALDLSGLNQRGEAALVAASSQWLTDLTTRF
jgi:hypothetical protein